MFNTLKEIQFLLECYNNTPIDRETFLNRVEDLHSTGIISDYAIVQVFDILGESDEQLRQ